MDPEGEIMVTTIEGSLSCNTVDRLLIEYTKLVTGRRRSRYRRSGCSQTRESRHTGARVATDERSPGLSLAHAGKPGSCRRSRKNNTSR